MQVGRAVWAAGTVTVSAWDLGGFRPGPHARTLMDGMRGLAATRRIRGLEEAPRGRRQAMCEVWPDSLTAASDRPWEAASVLGFGRLDHLPSARLAWSGRRGRGPRRRP